MRFSSGLPLLAEKHGDEDKSDEAEQWQWEIHITAKLSFDDIKEEMSEKKMSFKVMAKVLIQIEKEAKEILENYKKELGIDKVKSEKEIADSAKKYKHV